MELFIFLLHSVGINYRTFFIGQECINQQNQTQSQHFGPFLQKSKIWQKDPRWGIATRLSNHHSAIFGNSPVNSSILSAFSPTDWPMRIRVRIGPPHPLVCRKRRLNRVVLRMRPEKQVPCHSRDPSCSKALSAEHRPKFCSPSWWRLHISEKFLSST
jgi:hypothetical protein